MKKNKKTKNKIIKFNVLYYSLLALLSIFLIILTIYKYKANFYCDIEYYSDICLNNKNYFELFLSFFIISVFVIIIVLLRMFRYKKKKISFFIIPIITSIIVILLTTIIYSKVFENKIIKNDDIKIIERYFSNKNQTNKINSIYEDRINNYIKKKNIKDAIKYLDNYVKISNNEEKIIEYKYKIALLCIDNIDYYDIGIKYFSDLKDYKDSSHKKKDLMYNYAINTDINSENYKEIVSILNNLSYYKDSKNKLKEVKYKYAKQLLKIEENNKAMAIFKELNDYKNSKKEYDNLYKVHKFDGYWSGEEKKVNIKLDFIFG